MTDWKQDRLIPPPAGIAGMLRILRRGLALVLVIYSGLVLLLLLRLAERPLFGAHRPWTPHITRTVCRIALRIIGLPLSVQGRPMRQDGAMVANHCSWLDIFVLNACDRIYFVAKAEVRGWAAIGWLARATGTLFITRKGTEARRQQQQFEDRLRAGHRLLFFPEGTSTDSRRVLPFKSTLFAAFFTHGLEKTMHIQPVTLAYKAPEDQDPRFYGWWGDMEFAPHLAMLLAAPRQGSVTVTFHDEIAVNRAADRKELARQCETAVRSALPSAPP